MSIKLFGGGGADEIAKAIPAAIKGYQDARAQDYRMKALEAKSSANTMRVQREQAMDRMKLGESGYDVSNISGDQNIYGLMNQGLIPQQEGFISMKDLKRQQMEQDIKYKGGKPATEQARQDASMLAKGFEAVYDDMGVFSSYEKSQALIDKENAALADKRAGTAKKKADGGSKESYEIPGLVYDGKTKLSATEMRKAREAVTQVGPLINNLTTAVDIMKNASRMDFADPVFRQKINGYLRDAQLTYKGPSFAALGVLTGPDMNLLDSVIADPFTTKGAYLGPKGVVESWNQAIDRIKTRSKSYLKPYGYTPEAGLYGKEESAPKEPEKYQAGQVVDGYKFKGGDPTDESNWSKSK